MLKILDKVLNWFNCTCKIESRNYRKLTTNELRILIRNEILERVL